jgi:hypothetical protein
VCRGRSGRACGNGAGRVTDIGPGPDVHLGALADFETCGDVGARRDSYNRPEAISDFGSNGDTGPNTCSNSYFRSGASEEPDAHRDAGTDPRSDANVHPDASCDTGRYADANPGSDHNSNSNPDVDTDPVAYPGPDPDSPYPEPDSVRATIADSGA